MKPQDILFLIILGLLFYKRNPKYFSYAGLICLLISIPLFAKWIFFTAERFSLYAFIFILIAIVLNLVRMRHNN